MATLPIRFVPVNQFKRTGPGRPMYITGAPWTILPGCVNNTVDQNAELSPGRPICITGASRVIRPGCANNTADQNAGTARLSHRGHLSRLLPEHNSPADSNRSVCCNSVLINATVPSTSSIRHHTRILRDIQYSPQSSGP